MGQGMSGLLVNESYHGRLENKWFYGWVSYTCNFQNNLSPNWIKNWVGMNPKDTTLHLTF